MNHTVGSVVLRQPEPSDLDALYCHKNDPEVANLLVGFRNGLSHAGMRRWLESHEERSDEVLWVIAEAETDRCLGHVGLYRIAHRTRSAEFGIMLGDKNSWGKGIGRGVTRFAVGYGFTMLNLNRVELTVLATNQRALGLYKSLGFAVEGTMRQAQFKEGQYIDVIMMSLLRDEFNGSVR